MVPTKERLEKPRQILNQSFLHAQSPIECQYNVASLLLKRPNTAAVEISGRANHETVRRIRLNDLGLPLNFVRQLTAGEQADSVTNGFFSGVSGSTWR
jgi:hypothetical protein